MTFNLTADEINAAFVATLSEPPSRGSVRDPLTHSIGLIHDDLGLVLSEHGLPNRRYSVDITLPKAHHKKGDRVIWRDPEPLG